MPPTIARVTAGCRRAGTNADATWAAARTPSAVLSLRVTQRAYPPAAIRVPGVAQDDVPDFDLAAAGLRADGPGAVRGIEALAAKLEDALPGRCRVERRAVRLFSRDKRVETLELELGGATYRLESDGHDVTATRGKAVGGVTIKRDELPLDVWLQALTDDLRELAQTSGEARAALDRLLGA
jgi:hypothetical protein